MPLYRVKIEGLSIVAVEPMFDLKPDMSLIMRCLKDYIVEQGKTINFTGNKQV